MGVLIHGLVSLSRTFVSFEYVVFVVFSLVVRVGFELTVFGEL